MYRAPVYLDVHLDRLDVPVSRSHQSVQMYLYIMHQSVYMYLCLDLKRQAVARHLLCVGWGVKLYSLTHDTQVDLNTVVNCV